jgi:protein phosphatase
VSSTIVRTLTAAASDVGRKRSGNEDSYDIWVSDALGREHLADTLLVVCDGMGGSNAGEVASRLAVDAVVRTFSEDKGDDVVAALAHAVEIANQEVHEHSRSRADLQGMGTTCTVAALKGHTLALAQVGDSRAYLVRAGRIRQLTDDHSLVAQLVARNQLTPAEARTDPRRNVVTRSVGVGPTVEVDARVHEEPLRAGDTLLLCSDGLHGQVSDEDLARLASGESLERACRELISLANAHGGPDNITVALARLEGPEGDEPSAPSRARGASGAREPSRPAPKPRAGGGSRQRTLRLLIVAFIALAIVLSGIIFAVLGLMHHQDTQHSSNAGGRVEERLAWR